MTALATRDDASAAEQLLAKLRDTNAANALIASQSITPILERLAIEGQNSPDLELARRAVETLLKVATHPEKQAAATAVATAAQAVLQIVLDDTPQEAPAKKRKRAVPADVVDVVELVPSTPAAAPAALSEEAWGAL